jgi:hypothetical protein
MHQFTKPIPHPVVGENRLAAKNAGAAAGILDIQDLAGLCDLRLPG